jgi:hypothetical protein
MLKVVRPPEASTLAPFAEKTVYLNVDSARSAIVEKITIDGKVAQLRRAGATPLDCVLNIPEAIQVATFSITYLLWRRF